MRRRLLTAVGSVVLAALPALALCAEPVALATSDDAEACHPCSVQWSRPVNGLSLGIEAPKSPFMFVPVEGWRGPVLVKDEDTSGSLVGLHSNPGGQWKEPAFLYVHLRNDSQRPAFWSKDHDVWHIVFWAIRIIFKSIHFYYVTYKIYVIINNKLNCIL